VGSDTPGAPKQGEGGLRDLAEDAVGFGAAEYRLSRDLFRRPRTVMDAYDREGSTAGGLYPRPLRYWLTLNGLYLALSAVSGWQERSLQASGIEEDANFAELARRAGKSLEEFNNDLEQWMSLVALPIYALVIGGALFLLIRRWSPLGDRQDFHQTFTFLNAWTLWTLPPSILAMLLLPPKQVILLTFPLMLLSIPAVYTVFGAGRWWRTRRGAVLKGLLLVLVAFVALVPYSLLSMALAVLGATLLP
jgi:hypothetical protein